jgi:hypothetical protein
MMWETESLFSPPAAPKTSEEPGKRDKPAKSWEQGLFSWLVRVKP